MSSFRGKRISEKGTIKIAAAPAAVFPLLCPEREKEWLDGWDYDMIYSQSGFAEPGCTFKTNLPPEGEAYWIMTRHVPPQEGEYVRIIPGRLIVVLSFLLAARDGGTSVAVTYTYTGLSAEGNAHIAAEAGSGFARLLHRMESSLNHFTATGTMLKSPQ